MTGVFNHHLATHSLDAYALEAAGGRENANFHQLTQSLLQHPWFQRVWVIQEATLSQHATLVHCGKETIGWDELVFVNEFLELSLPTYIRGQTRMPLVWKTLSGAGAQRRLARIPAAPDAAESAVADGGDGDGKGERQELLPILEVFVAALDMKATDPRDKLFALLAFGRETCVAIPAALRPDYTKSLPDVMADFTRWCIQQYRSLDVLSFVHCHPARAWQRTLSDQSARTELRVPRPTWAIGTEGFSNWSHMTLLKQFPQFRASADTVPDENLLRRDSGTLVLRLLGYALGSVVALGHPPASMVSPDNGASSSSSSSPPSQPDPSLRPVFHGMFDPASCIGLWAYPGGSHKNRAANPDYQNTMFFDHARAHASYVPAADPAPDAIFPAGTPDAAPGRDGRFHQGSALPACIDRCFFLASDGSYGLCPWTVREGDVIAVLHGGRIPHILRPVPPPPADCEHEDGRLGYQLIGECFIDRADVMNGEFIRKGKIGTSDSKPVVFVLV